MKQVGRDVCVCVRACVCVCVCVCVLGRVRKRWRVRRDSRKKDQQEQSRGTAGHTAGSRVSQGSGRSSRAELWVTGKPGSSDVLEPAYITGADC